MVEAVLDLSGRPFVHYGIEPPGEKILGDPPFDPQLAEEFWRALVTAAGVALGDILQISEHSMMPRPMPLARMEAMAAARPVVATYIAGTPELVQPGQTGWLVPVVRQMPGSSESSPKGLPGVLFCGC